MHGAPIDLEEIRADFRGEVRLFPLPNLVLFPDSFAPLKVFEERYVRMVEDAKEDDGLIAMALLKPGWEPEYEGRPPIHPIVCVGKMLRVHKTPSGQFDVLLYGLLRARVLEEMSGQPFRRARVEILDDRATPVQAEDIARRMHRALDLVPGRKSVIWEMRRMANQLRGLDSTPGRYADAVANASDLQHDERYALLAEQDVLRRLERLIRMLELRAYGEGPPLPPDIDPSRN